MVEQVLGCTNPLTVSMRCLLLATMGRMGVDLQAIIPEHSAPVLPVAVDAAGHCMLCLRTD